MLDTISRMDLERIRNQLRRNAAVFDRPEIYLAGSKTPWPRSSRRQPISNRHRTGRSPHGRYALNRPDWALTRALAFERRCGVVSARHIA